jgi:hypothetical protein
MSSGGLSVFVFGIYVVINGFIFSFFPNFLLRSIKLPETQEPWIRLIGVLSFVIGYYYIQTGRDDNKSFFKWTVHARIGVFLISLLFFFLGWAPLILILFASVDLAGALWTLAATRAN